MRSCGEPGGRPIGPCSTGPAPYLEYLLDRASGRYDLNRPDGRREFVQEMLAVAARIPEATTRDEFADRLAHKARIAEEVIRTEIRKAAVASGRRSPPRRWRGVTRLKPAERDLLAALLHDPARAMRAVVDMEDADLEGLASEATAAAGSFARPPSRPRWLCRVCFSSV